MKTSDPDEAVQLVRAMKRHLSDYFEGRARLQNLGLGSLEEAVDRLEELEARADVPASEDTTSGEPASVPGAAQHDGGKAQDSNVGTHFASIRETLGLSDAPPKEAVAAVRSMRERLQALREEGDALGGELGLSDPQAVVDTVRRVDDQLAALLDGADGADAASPDPEAPLLHRLEERMEQLQAHRSRLLERRDALQDELATLKEEREAMRDELDGLRDGHANLQEKHVTLQDEHAALQDEHAALQDEHAALQDEHAALQDEQTELEEKRASLSDDLSVLEEQLADLRARLDALEEPVGTADPGRLSAIVESLRDQLATREAGTLAREGTVPPLLDESVLGRLEGMTADELHALDVGAVAVDDDGLVRFANHYTPALPGLDDAKGDRFFDAVLPQPHDSAVRARFEAGIAEEDIWNVRFFLAAVPPEGAPVGYHLHMHSKADERIHWILYKQA
jgi:FtsZ-binding cell division protein ZapB